MKTGKELCRSAEFMGLAASLAFAKGVDLHAINSVRESAKREE